MKVFVTGGTGSLGTALLRRAESLDWEITVYSRDEVKQGELRNKFPKHNFLLGDIRDVGWLTRSMRYHDLVIHAAAYKQVPAAEVNSGQATEVNVIGSINVAEAAVDADVERVIGISTDKSCAPVNCYGATKMVMEKVFQEACHWGGGTTQFNLVRYGNVLGSRGSVVPFFKQQWEKDRCITLTNPRMTRFWLTLDDAVDLVVKATEEENPGTVLIPKCPASTMLVLAQAVVPEAITNMRYRVIGMRPGEKIHEQLVHSGESMHTDDIETHYRVYPASTGYIGNLPEGFEYRSDTARQLTVHELKQLVGDI